MLYYLQKVINYRYSMKIFVKLMLMGIVLVTSCMKMEIDDSSSRFISMEQEGSVVFLNTPTSTESITISTEMIEETSYQTDTISYKVSKINEKNSYGRIHFIETGEVVKQIKNFELIEKRFDCTINLPVQNNDGGFGNVKTEFSFTSQIPVLNGLENNSVSIEVSTEFVSFYQDPEFTEPYSTVTYEFTVIVYQKEQQVGTFKFKRDFSWENMPITFEPSIEDWDTGGTGNVNL